MIGAHFDSWHGGTGATDNAAGQRGDDGSDAGAEHASREDGPHGADRALERRGTGAVRIEGVCERALRRSGEGEVDAEHPKLAAYFNLDNGSGRIRGVYLQDNDAARPFFEQALIGPFRDLGVSTISLRNTGGTDHLSFDDVGLPGFQFIQDPLDYRTVTHHSSMDTLDHVVAADLMQASAVIASVVAQEANGPEMMPRKPLPTPRKGVTGP